MAELFDQPDPSDWFAAPAAAPDRMAEAAALARQGSLTKPHGSLGRLEAVAVRLAALQRTARPRVDRVRIAVFAADHGVAAEGVSAFPQAVTGQMLANFAVGGAAICVLARALGADLELVDLGTAGAPLDLPGVLAVRLGPGTANLAEGPAMTGAQLAAALAQGGAAVRRALALGTNLFIAGEMGIANTTSAAALACALLGREAGALTGPGTGLDEGGVAHKAAVVARALGLHRPHLADPLEALRRLGGFEIAAMTGAYAACAQAGLPALVDGFIASVAALTAVRLCHGAGDWLLYSHRSAEPGHALVLAALGAEPLLALGMRLGEGSGAAAAVPLLRLACALHGGMATFAEAGVSRGKP
jgi:nicotinate-nucleotide--dimethylbenzimidazole phosphoribosyltransferase